MEPVNVAVGIIRRGPKILICRRKAGRSFGGYWEFPGGKCEAGESPEACLRRELWEELAIRVGPPSALPAIEYSYPDFTVRLHPFLCAHLEGEPRPLASRRLLWVEPARLADYRFPPANDRLIEYLIGGGQDRQ